MSKPETLGEFEQSALLAIAHLGDNAYGVTIRSEIEASAGRTVASGTLYTALDRLQGKGLAPSKMSDPTPDRGGRSKRHFVVRPAGATALRETRARLDRMWAGLEADLKG